MAPTDLLRCSIASLHRGDPQAGTAPVAKRWLLIEHQGPWAKKPMETEPLLGPLGVEIETTAASVGGKVLLVRRPDPWPTVFGYHEVWHLLTVVAAGLHFAAVTNVLV